MPAWLSFGVAAIALAAYLAWCPSVEGDKDSPEFTLVLATLGLSHPTGYPLYTLLGYLFVRPLHAAGATWAYAANAWSALGGAVAVGLLHALAARLLASTGISARTAALAALLPIAAFAANPIWTVETTLAEVNSWHVAWAAGAALSCVSRLLRPRGARPGLFVRDAAVWGLLCGIGLAHHRTSVLLAAPLTVALLARFRPRTPQPYLAWLGGALVPVCSYAYVVWRSSHPAVAQWPSLAPRAASIWELVSGAGYSHFLGHFAPSEVQSALLARYVFPWLVPALLASLFWPLARSPIPRVLRVGLAACVLVQAVYAFCYGVPDPASYFLVPVALGLAMFPAVVAAYAPVRRFAIVLIVPAALGVTLAAWSWPSVALDRVAVFNQLEQLTRSMWRSITQTRGFVIWEDDMWYRLLGYQLLDGENMGLVVVNPIWLEHPQARRTFRARYGFDPLQGLPTTPVERTEKALDQLRGALVESLGHTGQPVWVFLPQVSSVRLLRPGTGDTGAEAVEH